MLARAKELREAKSKESLNVEPEKPQSVTVVEPTEPFEAKPFKRKGTRGVTALTTTNKALKVDRNGDLLNAARMDLPYQRLVESIGEDELQEALALSTEDKFQLMLGKLAGSKQGIVAVAKSCGIKQYELADLMRKSAQQKALLKMAEGLPAVAEDLVYDALSKTGNCPRCDGYGEIPDERAMIGGDPEQLIYRQCPECGGQKTRDIVGDAESRKLLMEAAGITNKKGPLVAINQNFGMPQFGSVIGELDKWDKERLSDRPKGDVIDAEVVWDTTNADEDSQRTDDD